VTRVPGVPADVRAGVLRHLQARRAAPGHRPQGEARDWFSITAAADDEAEVRIFDYIDALGVNALDFVEALDRITAKRINLRINSGGGSVFDAVAIFDAVARHPAHVVASVEGLAASAASFILQAGDERVITPFSTVMVHDASGLTVGDAEDHREQAALLDKISDMIASIYASRSRTPAATWRTRMKSETWYDADEAATAGLVDGVLKGPAAGKGATASTRQPSGARLRAQLELRRRRQVPA
jgi:ATP-dependent Clp endopeptidase proteolytic subunit ClpP